MSKIDNACEYAISVANDNSHGYDQIHRWLNPDVDCSSLVIIACENSGIPVKTKGATYTGNMRKAFKACGFKELVYLKGMPLKRGDILLCDKYVTKNGVKKYYGHTCFYLGNGKIVQASINEKGTATGGKGGDQTGKEVSVGNFYEYSKGWDCVLRYDEDEEVETVNVEMPVLRFGDSCYEVGTLQIICNARGYKGENGKPLTVDKQFGKNTRFAVHSMQLDMIEQGIIKNADDICGKYTWNYALRGL